MMPIRKPETLHRIFFGTMIARSDKEPMIECSLNRPVSDARMTVTYVRSYTSLIVSDAYTFTPHGGTGFNHVF